MPLILNGDTGISGVDGTAGTPSLQGTDSNTGVFYATDIVGIATNGTERMRIDSAGNVGIGVTPSAWSAYKGLNIGLNTTLAGSTGGSVALLSTNAYFDGSSYKYITTDAATQYQQNTGQHIWRGAASGTAGNTLTFTQILALERTKSLALEGASSQSGTGITFPATQSASSDANTLDDYEEGTWTPTVGNQTVTGSFSSNGTYTKIGRQVFFRGQVIGSTSIAGAAGTYIGGLPFTSTASGTGSGTIANQTAGAIIFIGPSDTNVYIIGGYAATGNFEFSGMYFA